MFKAQISFILLGFLIPSMVWAAKVEIKNAVVEKIVMDADITLVSLSNSSGFQSVLFTNDAVNGEGKYLSFFMNAKANHATVSLVAEKSTWISYRTDQKKTFDDYGETCTSTNGDSIRCTCARIYKVEM